MINKLFSTPDLYMNELKINNDELCQSSTDEGLFVFAQMIHSILDDINDENTIIPNNGIHSDTKHGAGLAKSAVD